MISGKTIFISPLDWGMGHATRCVPIIRELAENNKVLIGVTQVNLNFFEALFPHLEKIEVPSYAITYSKTIPAWIKLLLQGPKIRGIISSEKRLLEKLVGDFKIDLVISDNRFGLSTERTKCIFITHQLKIKAPFFSYIANLINENYIHSFSEVWVPDHKDENERLSGQLSDSARIEIPVKYIGPKSALVNPFGESVPEKECDYLILLSGVEPQRTILEKLMIEKFKGAKEKVILVRGTERGKVNGSENLGIINFAGGNDLKNLIVNAGTVICRSGYSTLMDLYLLNQKNIILVPTPGQTEQEYLAAYWHKKFGSKIVLQKKISSFKFN